MAMGWLNCLMYGPATVSDWQPIIAAPTIRSQTITPESTKAPYCLGAAPKTAPITAVSSVVSTRGWITPHSRPSEERRNLARRSERARCHQKWRAAQIRRR